MLEKGDKIDLFVTYVEAEGSVVNLWSQTDFEQYAELEALMKDIDLGQAGDASVDPDSLSVGDVYLAKYSGDGNWYRAQVTEVDKSVGVVKVFFIDFGNTETVTFRSVIKGAPKYFALPPQAAKFRLADISPANCGWSSGETDYLKEKLSYGEFSGIVLEAGTVGLGPTVRVFDPERKDSNIPLVSSFISNGIGASYDNAHLDKISFGRRGLKVGIDHHVFMSYTTSPFDFWVRQVDAEGALEELHALLADYLTSPASIDACSVDIGASCLCQYGDTESYYRAIVTNVFKDKSKCQITFIDYGDSEIVDLDCIKFLPAEFSAHPPHAIHCSVSGEAVNTIDFDKLIESDQIYVRVLTRLHSGTHIVELSERRSSSTANSPSQSNVAMYSHIQFDASCFQDVCISDIDNAGHFSVQLVSTARYLDDLMADLQDMSLVPLTNPEVGMPCLVKDANDGLVYRVEITATSQRQARVRFVDFSSDGAVVVNNAQLYTISTLFMKLPTQAIPCSLSGVEDRMPAEISDALRRYSGKTPLVGKFVCKTAELFEVELYDTRDERDVKISDIVNGTETGASSVISRQPKLPELEVLATEKLYVTCILDDSTFVGQLSRFPMATLERFQYELCELYSTKNVPNLSNPSPGDICCTSFSLDGAFYRGTVQEVCRSKVTVKFIDYGNSEVKEMNDVKVLSSEFHDFPPQGVTCRLDKSYAGLTKENLEAALLEKEITVAIDDKIRSIYLVTLPACSENREIVSHLKSFGQTGQTSRNDHLGSRKTAMTLHGDMDFIPPTIKPHVWSEVVVTLVDDPEHFYCQLTASEGKLNDLMAEIDDYCSHLAAGDGDPGKVVLHMPLIAKYSEDEGWYRARVTGVLASRGGVEVMFVDYGNHEVVTPAALRRMLPQFMKLPTQAIPCSLAGVKGQGRTEWSQEDTDAFSAIVLEGKYQALFDDSLFGVKGQYITDLYDGTTSINAKFLACVDKLSREFQSQSPSQAAAAPGRRNGSVAASGDHEEETIRKPRTTSIAATMLRSPGDKPMARYKQPSLPENQYFDLFVAHSVNPGRFWCQAAGSTPQLDTMMEKLDAEYSSLGPSELRLSRLGVGEMCCARYSVDGSWYRAVIRSMTGEREATVQFVDYGNEERQPVEGIKQLRAEYVELAAQAFQCCLAGVMPLPAGAWSTEASAMFEELTGTGEAMKIVGCIIEKDVSAGVYTVELNRSNGPVHEELIKAGFAVSTEAPLQRRLSESSTASRTSNSSRGSGGRPTDEPKYKSLQLKTGQFVDVNVSHVTSPTNFWCQLTEFSRDLQQITEQLAVTYEGLATSDLELLTPAVGRVCCGRFTEDDLWYRGVVVELERDRCLVQFVDYGNDEWLPRDRIKQLKSSLAELPTQALQCSLEGISPCGSAWLYEEKQAFEDLTIDKNLLAKLSQRVKGGPSPVTLSLVDDASGTEVQIADELVRRGFALSTSGTVSSQRSPPRRQVEPPVVFNAFEVEKGIRYKIAVSWVNSPSDFYCQLARSADQLSALVENMYKFYDRLGSNELPLTGVTIGQPCVAHYPADGCWYRSCITEIIPNGRLVVKYVDYGNTETVDTSKVKAITAEFAQLPMQAIGCCLGNIQAPGGGWNKDIVGKFEELVSVPLMLTSMSVSSGVYTVCLTTRNSDNIAEVFSKALAPPQPERRPANVAQARQTNVAQAPPARQEPPTRQAPPVRASPPAPSAKYASSYSCVDLSSRYRPGDKAEVEVAHVDSLTKFYIQVVTDIPQLDDLMNTMETYYAKPENTAEHPDVAFSVDTACVAQFCEDDLWYRAKVTGIAGDKWTVHFVDYGNSEVTGRSRLRPLPSEFAKLPPTAVECSLADIGAVQVQAAITELSSLALSKRCQVTVKAATQSAMQVHLQVDGVDINAKFQSAAPGGAVEKYLAPVVPATGAVDVYVTSVVSLAHFYVQTVANEDKVVELAEKITEEYVALPPGDRPVSQLAVGMAVCAMYSVDGAWYRAVVTEVCADNRVSVRFIDYGNVETVDVGDLRTLTAEYLSMPPFCIRCALSGVQSGSPENIETLTTLTEGGEKILQAEFLSSTEPCRVTLHDGDTDITAMFPACETPEGFTSVTPPGGEVDVYVSHVESPNEFYVQLVSREAELEAMVESLLAYVQDGEKLGSVDVGQVCVACFHDDEAWYRALVTAVSGNDVTVRYVDFGNSSSVSLSDDIKDFIDVAHKTPEPVAIQCTLGDVTTPPGGWPADAKDTLTELTADKALAVSFETTSEPCQLKFTDVTIIDGIKQATPSGDVEQTISPEVTGVDQATPLEVTQYPDITVPSEKCQVYVCQVTSPTEVYLQLLKNEATLNELVDKVDKIYSSLSDTERTLKDPKVGTPCCAMQAEVWYRAVVCERTDDGIVVKFVDYGNTDTVDTVKQIDGALCQMAPLAYQCSLAGIQPTDGTEWPEVVSDKIFELTDQKVLTAEFLTSDAVPYSVALWENTTNISDELVAALPEVEAKAVAEEDVGDAGKYPKVALPSQDQAGFVAAFVNPGDFYVQLSDQESDLAELMSSLVATYNGPDSSSLVLANPAPGGACCVRSSTDDQWYRAMIDSLEDDTATVTLIDCGTSETLSTEELRRVLPEFLRQPPFAIHCHLAGLEKTAEWTPDEMTLFLERALDKDLTVTLGHDAKGDIEARLMDGTVDIASLFPGRTALMAIVEEGDGDTPEADQSDDKTTTLQTDTSDLVGHKVEVYVSHFVSPTRFWCQLVRSEAELTSLSEKLSDASLEDDWEPSIGALSVIRYKDDSLYRARVLDVEDGTISVFCIDYGNTTSVPRKSAYPSRPEWNGASPFALQCRLDGLAAVSEDGWTEETQRVFGVTVTDKTLLAEFVSVDEIGEGDAPGPSYVVNLWDKDVSVRQRVLDSVENSTEDSFCTAENSEEEDDDSDVVSGDVGDVALVLDACELPRQGKFEVCVSHVKSPSKFWVQKRGSEAKLKELSGSMQEGYATRPVAEFTVDVGCVCAVRSVEEESWCRARVTSVDADNVDVVYVDYGNSETVDRSNVHPLLKKFATLSVQAVVCRLDGVAPPEGSWSDSAIGLFTESTCQRCLIAEVTSVTDDDTYVVNLLDMGMSVAQKMVDAQVAVDTKTHDTETLDSSVDDRETDSVRYTCTPLKKGDTLEVHVVSAVSPCNFWCQPAKSSTTDLPLLMDKIQDCYLGSEVASEEVDDLSISMPCVAQFSNDEIWHRAMITSIDGDTVTVRFVDYGNTRDVSRSKVRAIVSHFTELPMQAFKCVLSGVSPVGGAWDAASCNRFQEMVVFEESKEFRVEVVTVTPGDVLEVSVTLWDGQSSIGQQLVDSGYGVESTQLDDSSEATAAGDWTLQQLVDKSIYMSLDVTNRPDMLARLVFGDSPRRFMLRVTEYLRGIKESIAEVVAADTTTPGTGERYAVEDACLVRCGPDSEWHRAFVTATHDDTYEVVLVDYGTRATVSAEAVRPVTESILDIPAQVFTCSLAGIEAPNWTPEGSTYFKEICADRELRVSFVIRADNNVYPVYMYDATNNSTSTINTMLVERGFASMRHYGTNILERSFLEGEGEGEETDTRADTLDGSETQVTQPEIESFHQLAYVAGQQVAVQVVSARDPDNIVCQRIDSDNTFQTLMTQLAVEYAAQTQSVLANPCIGQPCCVRYTRDGTWRRAQVLAVRDDTVDVYHVDYGKKETVPGTAVRDLQARFLALPAQTTRCCLHRVEPMSLAWSDDIRDVLEEACCRESNDGQSLPVTLTVISTDDDDRIIVNIETCEGVNLRELLMDRKLAVVDGHDPEAFDAIREEQAEGEDGSGEEEVSGNTLEEDVNAELATMEYKQRSLKEGQNCTVFLSHCVNPGQIWCQVASDDLQVLMDRMQDYYCDEDMEAAPSHLKDGDMCCVLSTEDNLWYRAQVESSYEDVYTVLFVDYGHTETTRLARVRPLVSMFCSQPPFAVQCALAGLEPLSGDEWSDDSITQLQGLAEGPMIMKVVEAPSGGTVRVELTPRSQGASVADTLVAEKCAKRPPRTVVPDKAVVGEQGDLSQKAVGESGASVATEGGATHNGVESAAIQEDSGSDAEAPSGDEQGDGAAAAEHNDDDTDVVSGGDASCVGGASCGAVDTPDSVTDTPKDVVDTSKGASDTPDGASEVCDGLTDTPGAATDTADGASDTPSGAADKSGGAGGASDVPVSSEES